MVSTTFFVSVLSGLDRSPRAPSEERRPHGAAPRPWRISGGEVAAGARLWSKVLGVANSLKLTPLGRPANVPKSPNSLSSSSPASSIGGGEDE